MKYLRFGIYILVFFILISPFLILPRIIKVNGIECYSQYGLCSDNFIDTGSIMNLSFYEAKTQLSEKLNQNMQVNEFSIRFKLPSILRVDTILKKAKYALYNNQILEINIIDSDGIVLEKVQNTNLPYLLAANSLASIGEKIKDEDRFTLELLYGIYYLYQIKTGEIIEDGMKIKMSDGIEILFPLEGERDILLGSMKIILSRLNTDQNSPKIGKVKEIDLRYKNPVIRYE